ncbi:class I SAM-dependent methyltransferase [Candidatus Omnitrophota bacterium]
MNDKISIPGVFYSKLGNEREILKEYLEYSLVPDLSRFADFRDKKILDFGTGSGTSAFALIVAGANNVHGVDIVRDRILLAKSIANLLPIPQRHFVEFMHCEDTSKLPFEDKTFDICVCNAVLEHIPRRYRKVHLQEMFRILKDKGLLFIRGTPNRIFPKDSHLTELWFVHWMPFSMAGRYALLRKRITTLDRLETRGIDGCLYWEVINNIKSEQFKIMNHSDLLELNNYFKASLENCYNRVSLFVRNFARRFYITLNILICKPLNIPIAAFLPFLTLCLRKESTSNNAEEKEL